MQVADIMYMVRQKIMQRGQLDRNSNRHSLADYEMDAVATEVATELSKRFTRPVITFTRNDVLTAASLAGFQIGAFSVEGGGTIASPIDESGNDIYDKLHKVVEWSFSNVMDRLPENEIQRQVNR